MERQVLTYRVGGEKVVHPLGSTTSWSVNDHSFRKDVPPLRELLGQKHFTGE